VKKDGQGLYAVKLMVATVIIVGLTMLVTGPLSRWVRRRRGVEGCRLWA